MPCRKQAAGAAAAAKWHRSCSSEGEASQETLAAVDAFSPPCQISEECRPACILSPGLPAEGCVDEAANTGQILPEAGRSVRGNGKVPLAAEGSEGGLDVSEQGVERDRGLLDRQERQEALVGEEGLERSSTADVSDDLGPEAAPSTNDKVIAN